MISPALPSRRGELENLLGTLQLRTNTGKQLHCTEYSFQKLGRPFKNGFDIDTLGRSFIDVALKKPQESH